MANCLNCEHGTPYGCLKFAQGANTDMLGNCPSYEPRGGYYKATPMYNSDCLEESQNKARLSAKGDIKGFIIGCIIGGLLVGLMSGSINSFVKYLPSILGIGFSVIGARWFYRKGWIIWGWLVFFAFPLVGLCAIFKDISILRKHSIK